MAGKNNDYTDKQLLELFRDSNRKDYAFNIIVRKYQERKSTTAYFLQNSENMSEEEAGELMEKYISYQKKETGLLEVYAEKFREFLPEKKVLQVFILEVQFRQWLLKTNMQPRPNTR